MKFNENRLFPIKFIERKDYKDIWLFKCSCGNEKIGRIQSFNEGLMKSCGCILQPSREEYLKKIHKRLLQKSIKNNGCIEFTGKLDKGGYGVISFKNGDINRPYRAHRAMFYCVHGFIDDNKLILHSCNNRKCINIDHLRLGTYQDNSDDAINSNRLPRGEKCYHATMTLNDVKAIRKFYKNGETIKNISTLLKLNYCNVWNVAKNKTWRNVT